MVAVPAGWVMRITAEQVMIGGWASCGAFSYPPR